MFLSSFRYTSNSFLNFRLSGTRLFIKWFLIKNRVDVESSYMVSSSDLPNVYSISLSSGHENSLMKM